jgi:uncharacterized protein YndB with AHSA1/START domain
VTPLVVEFSVNASCEHAFDMWANRPALWWPRSHTMTRAQDLDIVFEGRAGGRIFERAGDGTEHAWGEVTDWDPPNRVAYRWHLFFDPAEATDVEVTFSPGASGTDVRIEHRGWERLGDAGGLRRTNTDQAWGAIVPVFIAACDES